MSFSYKPIFIKEQGKEKKIMNAKVQVGSVIKYTSQMKKKKKMK